MQSTFTQLFGATPRGASHARQLVANRIDVWGFAHGSEASDAVTLVVAELAANAVRHGRVRGRGFRVRLVLDTGVVRVEVLDARTDRLPVCRDGELGEGGRGLPLVEALAEKWGVELRPDGIYETVWADVRVDSHSL
ncbi:ATP-binding protein [Streptomyces brasiliensis]|uniref:ATP-binding protein n=1 Tax=Streptomyces brasiliensis TaxID=1954 RepID=A0A917KN25_9ACTN|nr:ATP-binding protein [Streptomyces brasiliensis]GGJ21420.1 ATP-binding protein [Streptomyces brasiliensis]